MQLRDLTLDQLRWLHATELHEAFPAEELKPFPAMEQLFRRWASMAAASVPFPLGERRKVR